MSLMPDEISLHFRPGFKFMYELKEGDTWIDLFDDSILVVNPNHKPKIVHSDGRVEDLDPKPQPPLSPPAA